MILADYPGNTIAGVLIIGAAVLLAVAFRANAARKSGAWRWLLGVMALAGLVSVLILLWNPSALSSHEQKGSERVLVFFDTSRSMSIPDMAGKTRLDAAVHLFEKYIESDSEKRTFEIHGFDWRDYRAGGLEQLRRWGDQTDLRPVVSGLCDDAVLEQEKGMQQVVGAVIFTDGQAIAKTPASYAWNAGEPFPVTFVGMGDPVPAADLRVRYVSAPARVALDSPVNVDVAVTGCGVPTDSFAVEVLNDGMVMHVEAVSGTQLELGYSFRCRIAGGALGAHVITARLAALPDELNIDNNQAEAAVEVMEEPAVRVLLYTQEANFDVGKMREALARDKRVSLDVGFDVIRSSRKIPDPQPMPGHMPLPETMADMNKYDVIVLGPCEMTSLTDGQKKGLYRFVTERGGGLILLPGRTSLNIEETEGGELGALLPVCGPLPPYSSAKGATSVPRLTEEGLQSEIIAPAELRTLVPEASPYRRDVAKKPAASVLLSAGDTPLVVLHRVGRGQVCYLNVNQLFRWYREDLEGGALRKLVSGLVTLTGSVTSREAGLEVFVVRSPETMQDVMFEAAVRDAAFAPVSGATVLLDLNDESYRMEERDEGRYGLTLDLGSQETIFARVAAEKDGIFLGETMHSVTLPLPRGEMDETALDESFLADLAEHVNASYVSASAMEQNKGVALAAGSSFSKTENFDSVWRRWSVFLAICLILTAYWFTRRAVGLV